MSYRINPRSNKKKFWKYFWGIIASLASILGILWYFGINPFSHVATHSSDSVEIGGDASNSTIIQSSGGDVNVIQPTLDNNVIAAEQVTACMNHHNLAHAQNKVENSRSIVLSFCDWPPPPYAEPDGFTEIKITTVDGPQANLDIGRAELYAEFIDRIQANCKSLELSYNFGAQGGFIYMDPFEVEIGSIIDPFGKTYDLDADNQITSPAYWSFNPDRNEVDVLYAAGFSFDSAKCIR